MKSNAELCVIREKSVLIPGNRARPSPPPRPQPFSDHLKIRKKFHNSENCPPPVHPLSYLFTYVFMGTFLNSTILGRKRTGDEVMFDVTRPWTGSGNVQEGC